MRISTAMAASVTTTAAALLLPIIVTAMPSLGQLQKAFPQISIEQVEPTAVDGIWELLDRNGQVFYVTEDGEHLFAGELLEVRSQRSLTEERRKGLRLKLLESAPSDLVRFIAAEPQHEVTVVTDIDCGYCRRLHQQVAEYNAAGISINYLMMPRAGIGSASYQKAVNASCADQPDDALTAAMAGLEQPQRDCEHSVAEQFSLAQKLGVTGTPTIVFADGQVVPGYLPPQELSKRLGR